MPFPDVPGRGLTGEADTNVPFFGGGGDRLVVDSGNIRLDNGGVQAVAPFTSPAGLRYDANTQPIRTVMIPLAYAGNTGGWISAAGGLISLAANAPVEIPLTHFLRTGSVVRRIRVAYRNSASVAPGFGPSFRLVRKVADKTTPSIGELNDEAVVTGGLGAASQIMFTGNIISATADLATEEWFVRLTSSNNSSGDIVFWVEARIVDPGPRNH